MRKTIYRCLGISMLLWANLSFGQLISWPLTTDGAGLSNHANIVAGDLAAGAGVSVLEYDPVEGARSRGWATDTLRAKRDYLEFCISTTGGAPEVSNLAFEVWQSADGPTRFDVLFSLDGFQTVDSLFSADAEAPGYSPMVDLSGLNIGFCGGAQLCFRIYAYGAASPSGFFGIRPHTLTAGGVVPAGCSYPSQQAAIAGQSVATTNSITITINPGNGMGQLVAVRPGAPVDAQPCDGNLYAASPVFGNGDRLTDGSYVVWSSFSPQGGSLTVTGLAEGTTYHFAVFEKTTSSCYKPDPGTHVQTTTCQNPENVAGLSLEPGNGHVTLAWNVRACNEVMIVASTAPVTGAPQGAGANYQADPEYGAGVDLGSPPDFSAPEFIVFKSAAENTATITGLNNNQTYHFRAFSRLDDSWTAGIAISGAPTDGCTELGGYEKVYLNEINHYQGNPAADRGVEVAGPAETDLTGYWIVLYGSNGIAYDTLALSGMVPNLSGEGAGVLWFALPTLEVAHGGIALYNSVTEVLVQFVSYRGDGISALESVAEGVTSENIGGSSGRPGASMQLIGAGNCPSDFLWTNVSPTTPGFLNGGQSFLPVELIDFRARPAGEAVRLSWETASELNNSHFEVERSIDGRSFREIGWVSGAGTVQVTQYYSFIDEQPPAGVNYYRLRQVDYDGAFEYTPVVAVSVRSEENALLLYPTLAQAEVNLSLAAPLSAEAEVFLFDLSGRVVYRQKLGPATVNQRIDTRDLAPGAYFVQVRTESEQWQGRFVKR